MTDTTTLLGDYLGILPETPEAEVLRLLIQTGAQIVGAEEGSLLVLDEDTNDLRFAMTVGSEESEQKLLGQRVPLGKGITGLAASTHEVQIGAPTFMNVQQTEQRGGGPEAVLAAPMLIGDTLIGVITAVSFKKGKRFTSNDALLYGRFASIAGVVVDQRRRLAAGTKAACDESGTPKVFGEAGRREQQILASIARIIKGRPHALEHLAQVLTAVEAMLIPQDEEISL
jgi:GAF domain-containing protein